MIKNIFNIVLLFILTSCTTQKITTKIYKQSDKYEFAKRYYQNMVLKNPKDIYKGKDKKLIPLNEFTKADVISILGVPYFIKKEGNKEIWKFFHKNKQTCTITILWDNKANQTTPEKITAYDKKGDSLDYNNCYEDMVKILIK